MTAKYQSGKVIAQCADCAGSLTTFENVSEFHATKLIRFSGIEYPITTYKLLRCAGCHTGALATIHHYGDSGIGTMSSFYPLASKNSPIPSNVPKDIQSEFREAEQCAAFGAFRASSGLIRSTLEKALKANGYTEGTLNRKINDATDDGVLTATRSKRAHSNVRDLGNDVMHDDWREVTPDEVDSALHYTQRILEDLYDDRPAVEEILIEKNRIPKLEEVK